MLSKTHDTVYNIENIPSTAIWMEKYAYYQHRFNIPIITLQPLFII
jgi:hypothetical protein